MEDFEKFVHSRLNHLRMSKENSNPSPRPSVIRFHGRAILPPLLSDEQREEMKQHRDAALKTGIHRTIKEKQIKAFVQNVLDTVQLRNSPSLDNFLQELNLGNSALSHNTTDESLMNKNLPSTIHGKEGASQLSSTSSALFATSVSSQNDNEVLRKHPDGQQDNQSSLLNDASCLSLSAGDASQPEGGSDFSEIGDLQKQFLGFGSSEQSHDMDEFYGSSSLDTMAQIPNIINYPPLDAEELERSGEEFSFGSDYIAVRDICSSSFKNNHYFEEAAKDTACDNASTSTGLECDIPSDTPTSDRQPCAIPAQNITKISGNSVSMHRQELQDLQPPEKPQRRSLQALLQKSQEYRRQQRMLRNQAKNSKTQERSRELSHSDKENDHILYKKAVSEWRKTLKEKRKTLPSSMTLKNNKLNITPLGINEDQPKTSLIQEPFKMKSEPSDPHPKFFSKVRRFPPILAPTFSKSVGGSDILCEKISFDQLQVVDESSRMERENSENSAGGVEANETQQLSQSSLHTNLVESELSGPEVISDVESTAVTNAEGQTDEWRRPGTCSDCDEGMDSGSQNCAEWAGVPSKIPGERPFSIDEESRQERRFDSEGACESLNVSELLLVKNIAKERKKQLTKVGAGLHISSNLQQHKHKLSAAQWKCVPDVFRNPVEVTAGALSGDDYDSSSMALDQSCGVNKPSERSSRSDVGSITQHRDEMHLTPDSSAGVESGTLKVKRRLLMNEAEEIQHRRADATSEAFLMATPDLNRALGGCERQGDPIELLKQIHAEQIRALQDEHRRQQRDLLQALTMRCGLPRSVSLPCSRLEDKPSVCLPEHHRPLLLAAVKGFLTRRLFKTERVAQLVRTVGDMQTFLLGFQQQSSCSGEVYSKQDSILLARVAQQLQALRYEVYDIFFSLSVEEKMQLISLDRELLREKQFRRQAVPTRASGGKKFISAATRKQLERKRSFGSECNQGSVSTGHKNSDSSERLLKPKRGQFRVNSQRDSQEHQFLKTPVTLCLIGPSEDS
ncbi:uncharacterized protein LOC128754506 isoform X2 [Synchiropus splendidus]|uniref:uncharacterized protein LOC128754506 isoform X2 n=1 Tax=Synchiropus splendidus TaxID=270530 RepID=UPI00237D627B|nr:uncharacterized protein LOC128754506 isoform X2 [Synchiropus splendidus]